MIPTLPPLNRSAEERETEFFVSICAASSVQSIKVSDLTASYIEQLSLLTQYTKDQLFEKCEMFIAPYLEPEQDRIRKRLAKLYTNSLWNSRYHLAATEIEKNIERYLNLVEKTQIERFIRDASKILEEEPKQQLEEAEKELRAIAKQCKEINELLAIRLDVKKNRERIETLIENTDYLPNCEEHFQTLCDSVEECEDEYLVLIQKQKGLLQREEELKRIASKLLTQNSKEILAPERSRFYANYSQAFWEAGVIILRKSFENTIKEMKKVRAIPTALESAIKKSAKISDFKHLQLHHCLNKKIEDFPEQYVHEVWTNFLGADHPIADTDDFMRFVLSKIPQEMFVKLSSDLRSSQNYSEHL